MSFEIVFPPSSEKFIRLQCNGDKARYICPPEIEFVDSYFQELNPDCVLDLGCGIGRIGVYLFKKYNWKDTRFVMADGDSGEVQLANLRTGKADFYNSMVATKEFCTANGLDNVELLNLEKQNYGDVKEKPDLVVSFYAFGFHWPIDFCLDAIYPYIKESCLLMFGMRTNIKSYCEWLDKQMEKVDKTKYNVIDAVHANEIDILILRKEK